MKVSTCDGKIYCLTLDQVNMCGTLKDMLVDTCLDGIVEIPSVHSEHFQVLYDLMTIRHKDLPADAEKGKEMVEMIEEAQVPFYHQCLISASYFNSPYLEHYLCCIIFKCVTAIVDPFETKYNDVEELTKKLCTLLNIPKSALVGYEDKEEKQDNVKRLKEDDDNN
jgi:hypothetical protein